MADTMTTRITKLASQLESTDNQIATLTAKRSRIADELGNLIGFTGKMATASWKPAKGTAKLPATKGTPQKPAKLTDLTYAEIMAKPGSDIQSVAKRLKVAPNRIGLAMYHLKKAGKVWEQAEKFYGGAGNVLGNAAKGTKSQPEPVDIPDDVID